jgi:hypothetical protein
VIVPDDRFAYFGTAAFAGRLLRLDQKIVAGVPMSLKRMANLLHRRRALSGILRSAFGVRRQDADALRGRAGGRGAGVLNPTLRLSFDLLRRPEAALFHKGIARVAQHKVILEKVKRPKYREDCRQHRAHGEHQKLSLAKH